MKKLIATSAIILLSACSLGMPPTQKLTVNTSEPGAEIWINGQVRGTSPLETDVERNKNVSIMARKDGYETGNRSLGTRLSSTGKQDIIGTILFAIPVIGLLSPGAWEIDETTVVIPMLPVKKL